MNLELLFESIKQICSEHNMSVSQLEKDLSFSTGSIGKWKTSAPSIEKVYAVAEYFEVTMDQLCGLKMRDNGNIVLFVEKLIEDTRNGAIVWFECTTNELLNIKFHTERLMDMYNEVHMSQTDLFEVCICMKEDVSQILDLYICTDKHYLKRLSVKKELLKKLYSCLQKMEEESDQKISSVIEEYMSWK